jgi:hypothetical protein
MDLFVVFKYLHVASMFFAVALAVSGEVLLRRIAASRDAGAILTAVERTKPLSGPVASGLFLGGLAFGIIAALAGQIDLLRPWLLLSYLAFAGAFAIGLTIIDPWVERLERAAIVTDDGGGGGTLDEVVDDPRARTGSWALMALIAILVFLMVVKPMG